MRSKRSDEGRYGAAGLPSAVLVALMVTQAIGIAVPELLYESVGIWNDYPSALYPTMLLLFVSFIFLVGVLVLGMNRWERAMRIPGYGS